MYLLGLGGYLYAGDSTQGNILLNVSQRNEWYFLLGRFGCGVTIVLATPLMALPCRESILEIVDVGVHSCKHNRRRSSDVSIRGSFITRVLEEDDDSEIDNEEVIDIPAIPGERTSLIERHDPIQKDLVFRNPWIHYGSTVLIVMCCYLAAVAVEGVAVVWSLCGSSMAFLIAFILPAAFFLRIERYRRRRHDSDDCCWDYWIYFAWCLLLFATSGAIVCTCYTISNFRKG